LRGRRTLEERGPYVVVRCNNVVLAWLIRDACFDRLDEEEDGGEEEEGGGVMIGCVREGEEQHRDEGCEEGKKFPAADFWGRCHHGLSVSRSLTVTKIQKQVLRLRRRMTTKKSQRQESRAETRPLARLRVSVS
jgi:hypothetical protein